MTMQAKSTLHWKTGEKLLAKNRTKQALYQFNEAIRLERNFNYYNSRGLTYLRLGDSKHAVEDFMEATRLEPDDVVAYYNLFRSTPWRVRKRRHTSSSNASRPSGKILEHWRS